MKKYTKGHSLSGLKEKLPKIAVFPNHYEKYDIEIVTPDFTSVCPRTWLPDFAVLTVKYRPDKRVIELKSFKLYLLAYRNLGIFSENVVNRVLEDIVSACKPLYAEVTGVFNARGGMGVTVAAKYPRV